MAPSSFPDFSSFGTSKRQRQESSVQQQQQRNILDFDQTLGEIHALGSTQFTGKQKKQIQAEQYKTLTGREPKQQRVPPKIMRGIKKKAAQRETKAMEEAQQSGVVTHSYNNGMKREKKRYSESNRRNTRVHGPSPTAGFMSKGILNVKNRRKTL